jgi:hypothetical protein
MNGCAGDVGALRGGEEEVGELLHRTDGSKGRVHGMHKRGRLAPARLLSSSDTAH